MQLLLQERVACYSNHIAEVREPWRRGKALGIMDKHDRDLYLKILYYALLNIRGLGKMGRGSECAIEADHVHNIPELLATEDPGRQTHYWDIERTLYLKSKSEFKSAFHLLWKEMEIRQHNPNAYMIHVPVEGSEPLVLQPTIGIRIGFNTYQLTENEGIGTDKKTWKFPPGSVVECEPMNGDAMGMLVAKRLGTSGEDKVG